MENGFAREMPKAGSPGPDTLFVPANRSLGINPVASDVLLA